MLRQPSVVALLHRSTIIDAPRTQNVRSNIENSLHIYDMRFKAFIKQINEQPLGGPPPGGLGAGAPLPPPGAPPGGLGGPKPMGGGLGGRPLGGLGGPPPPMGGGGLGGPPLGGPGLGGPPGAPGQAAAPQQELNAKDVWSLLEKLLSGEPIADTKDSGETPPPQAPAPGAEQPGMAPPPTPPGAPPMGGAPMGPAPMGGPAAGPGMGGPPGIGPGF